VIAYPAPASSRPPRPAPASSRPVEPGDRGRVPDRPRHAAADHGELSDPSGLVWLSAVHEPR